LEARGATAAVCVQWKQERYFSRKTKDVRLCERGTGEEREVDLLLPPPDIHDR
jgi:hypothetical protein